MPNVSRALATDLDRDERLRHVFMALVELQLLISNDGLFHHNGNANIIMPPLKGQPRPDFVPKDAPCACLPLPPSFLRKLFAFQKSLTPEMERKLSAMTEKAVDFAACLKLEKMGMPRLSNDRMGLNRALAFGDGAFESLDVDYEKMDMSPFAVLWLWHEHGVYRAAATGGGLWSRMAIPLDGGGSEISTLAGRLLHGLFYDFTRARHPQGDRMLRFSQALGKQMADYGAEWFGRSFESDDKSLGCAMIFTPGQLAGMLGGEAKAWLEYCELLRRVSWGVSRWIGGGLGAWMERMKRGDPEAVMFWKFAELCNSDFFAAGAVLMQNPAGPLAAFAASVMKQDAYKDEGYAQTPNFALMASLRDEGGSTYVDLGFLSGLPQVVSIASMPGLTFTRAPGALDAAQGMLCPKGGEELAIPTLLRQFIRNFPYAYRLPEMIGTGVSGFMRNLERLLEICGGFGK